ncbi:hypothetical protein D5S17_27515 [Pseudonocardiaceae bacterium YIM PH 21723]|nr:hypothetical protein D5S17_27515 [Pseudonocardiaceae bacterium YIM PH 21723]
MKAELTTWLARGRTQTADGAFCGWLEPATGTLSAPYPEITGYAVNLLSGQPAARGAAQWLAKRPGFAARPERTGPAVYAFDLAMIAHGLLRHGEIEAGLRYAGHLVTLYDRHGDLPAVEPGSATAALPVTWSTGGRAHLLKCVQALLGAADHGMEPALDVAAKLVQQGLGQLAEGADPPLRTEPDASNVSLHALCYAAEGLWIWGTRIGDTNALHGSRVITEWVWRHRLPAGGFPGHLRAGSPTQRQGDVHAQAIRLAALHGLPAAEIAEQRAALAAGLWRAGDEAAVYYWPDADRLNLNSWATMFAAQCTDPDTITWDTLV